MRRDSYASQLAKVYGIIETRGRPRTLALGGQLDIKQFIRAIMRIGAMCPHAKTKARIARLLKDRREYRHLGERQLIRHISNVLPSDAWQEHRKWLKTMRKQQTKHVKVLGKLGKVRHQ